SSRDNAAARIEYGDRHRSFRSVLRKSKGDREDYSQDSSDDGEIERKYRPLGHRLLLKRTRRDCQTLMSALWQAAKTQRANVYHWLDFVYFIRRCCQAFICQFIRVPRYPLNF